MYRAAVILGFWSAFLAIYDVLQKQAFRFIDWLVAQDFCGRRRSIRTEKECSGIWRLTRLRLSLVKLHQISQRQHPHSASSLEIKLRQAKARPTHLHQISQRQHPHSALSLEIKLRQAKARPTKGQIGNGMRCSN